jgi:hypothetical protein
VQQLALRPVDISDLDAIFLRMRDPERLVHSRSLGGCCFA